MSGSNRRPPACKAGALPAELIPLKLYMAALLNILHTDVCGDVSRLALKILLDLMVGLVGLEPTTPALSRRCSNQLSYRPSLLLRQAVTTDRLWVLKYVAL